MFRLQDNVPEVYIEQSRDFQLMCRAYDVVNNGVKYDIDTIVNILDPMKINDRMLNLLSLKVGFFAKREYESTLLRCIIRAFPFAIKYKGSKTGIEIAVSALLKAEGDIIASLSPVETMVQIDRPTSTVYIYTAKPIKNVLALDDFLSYILPIGFTYILGTHVTGTGSMAVDTDTSINLLKGPVSNISQLRGTGRVLQTSGKPNPFNFTNNLADKYIGSLDTFEIIGASNDTVTNKYGNDNAGIKRDNVDLNSIIEIKENIKDKGDI